MSAVSPPKHLKRTVLTTYQLCGSTGLAHRPSSGHWGQGLSCLGLVHLGTCYASPSPVLSATVPAGARVWRWPYYGSDCTSLRSSGVGRHPPALCFSREHLNCSPCLFKAAQARSGSLLIRQRAVLLCPAVRGVWALPWRRSDQQHFEEQTGLPYRGYCHLACKYVYTVRGKRLSRINYGLLLRYVLV